MEYKTKDEEDNADKAGSVLPFSEFENSRTDLKKA